MQIVEALNKYDFNIFLAGQYHLDPFGNIYFMHANSRNTIHVYNSHFSLIKTISIEGVEDEVQMVCPSLFKGSVGSVFSAGNNLLLGMSNPIICVISETGSIVQIQSLSKLFTPNQYYCRFYNLEDGKVMLKVENGDRGNLIALSKDRSPSIDSNGFPEFSYLNDTFSLPEAHFPNIHNLDCSHYDASNTIGAHLRKIRMTLQDPSQPYINHSPQMKIAKHRELSNGNLVLLVLSDTINRSGTPDKNMPYYFFILDRNTGEVIRYFSPDDRSLHKWNYYGDIIHLPDNMYLFKTFEYMFVYNEDFEMISTISLSRKYAVLKGLSMLNNYKNLIYWGDQKNQILYTSTFNGNIEEYLENTVYEVKNNLSKARV